MWANRDIERFFVELPGARPGSPGAFAIALAAVAAATGLRLAIDPLIHDAPFILFFPAIMLTTFLTGCRAGLFAMALSAAAAWYFILAPQYSFALFNSRGYFDLAIFALVATGDVILVGLLRAMLSRIVRLRALDRVIFDSNPDAIIVVDPRGFIRRANHRAETLLGYDSAQLIGQAVEMLVPDGLSGRHAAHRDLFISAPHSRPMGEGLALNARRADGELVPVDIQIGPVVSEGDLQIIANIRDVTEQRAAAKAMSEAEAQEAALAERERAAAELLLSNETLSKIIEAAPVAIYALDKAGRVTMWNPAAEAIYGIPADQVIGSNWQNPIWNWTPDGEVGSASLIEDALAGDGFQNREIRRFTATGGIIELSLSASLLRDAAGELTGFLFVARDITQTRDLTRRLMQTQRFEAVGQLTGGIAHDFNNLLAIIHGNLELLQSSVSGDDDAEELAGDALRAAKRGADLTHRLLAFSRQQQLAPTRIAMQHLLPTIIGMMRRVVEESIEIETRIGPDLCPIRIDSAQLENAILNLVINARDAMPDGGTITIAAENADLDEDYCEPLGDVLPGRYIRLSVTDTGSGMAKDVLDRAMEPFFTTKPVGQGTGLGLSMVFGFVKQSGGHVTLYSELGLGTTVTLYLPEAYRASIDTPRPGGAECAPDPAGRTILLVEDDESVRKLQRRMLDSLGCHILEAATGNEAIELLGQHDEIDLLLSDIVLAGGMSGPALAETARRLKPRLPVIFVSGYAPSALSRRFDLAAARTLTKPFTRSELAQALGRAFEEKEPE